MKPKCWSYGDYAGHGGEHCMAFQDVEGNCFWFSYTTLIAFQAIDHSIVIHDNDWGPVTGKHLNWINEDKSRRVPSDEFNQLFKEQFV